MSDVFNKGGFYKGNITDVVILVKRDDIGSTNATVMVKNNWTGASVGWVSDSWNPERFDYVGGKIDDLSNPDRMSIANSYLSGDSLNGIDLSQDYNTPVNQSSLTLQDSQGEHTSNNLSNESEVLARSLSGQSTESKYSKHKFGLSKFMEKTSR
jgi:hypothetical protein